MTERTVGIASLWTSISACIAFVSIPSLLTTTSMSTRGLAKCLDISSEESDQNFAAEDVGAINPVKTSLGVFFASEPYQSFPSRN